MAWPEDPKNTLPRANYASLKRPELERMLQEQANEIDSMKQVFYRETDALREQLQVLNAENRALKSAAEGKPLPAPQVSPAPENDGELRERLKPIVAKLVQKHNQELGALREECEETRGELARLREQYRETTERLEELQAAYDAQTQDRPDDANARPHIQEYQRALAAAQEQNARQEETIQALTRQIDANAAHYRAQRAQALEYLHDIRESFELFSQFIAPEDNPKPQNPSRVKPLFRDMGK